MTGWLIRALSGGYCRGGPHLRPVRGCSRQAVVARKRNAEWPCFHPGKYPLFARALGHRAEEAPVLGSRPYTTVVAASAGARSSSSLPSQYVPSVFAHPTRRFLLSVAAAASVASVSTRQLRPGDLPELREVLPSYHGSGALTPGRYFERYPDLPRMVSDEDRPNEVR